MTQMAHAGAIPPWLLPDRLRKARDYAGLEQQQLADDIGISRGSVSNYEKGATKPSRPVLLSWAMRCGVDLTWLATGTVTSGDGHDHPEEIMCTRSPRRPGVSRRVEVITPLRRPVPAAAGHSTVTAA